MVSLRVAIDLKLNIGDIYGFSVCGNILKIKHRNKVYGAIFLAHIIRHRR